MINTLPPAQLWIGNASALQKLTKQYLKQQLCMLNACTICSHCQSIEQKQHASLLWLTPEKNYTLELLEPIKRTIAFELEDEQQYFIIIEHAHLLTPACANSLLKVLEEPPRGYHFILLSQSLDALLPTIQSRCFIATIATHSNDTFVHDIAYALTAQKPPSAFDFLQMLEKSAPDEVTSATLIEQILAYWLEKYKISAEESNNEQQKKASLMIGVLQKGLLQPPMPGSSKIFWKNVFLHCV